MWVVFLLSAFVFGFAAMVALYIGNKVVNEMRMENEMLQKTLRKINTEEEIEKNEEERI